MAVAEKPVKHVTKQLRQGAIEFLSSRKYSNNLVDILHHFESGANQSACLLTLEMIFCELLKRREMVQHITPLKIVRDPETQYRDWLKNAYDETFDKILQCIDDSKQSTQMQALATAMKLLSYEGKYPLEMRNHCELYFPINRLKSILMKLLSSERNNSNQIHKFQEITAYKDVLYYCWKVLPPLTAKTHPNETYILNFLNLIDKLSITLAKQSDYVGELMCDSPDTEVAVNFLMDEAAIRRSINKIWNCVMQWDHTPNTHKQVLIVLLERILPHLDKPLLLTDFLMDSLDVGGPISLLALQGIFVMIQAHNLDYPNIFTKLYSMFEPEIFHTKFKARLFYLSDLFLSSTHLPENLVAAFAKRLARLALLAPSEDIIVICMFIGNLILRHPGLKCLLFHPTGASASSDPYIMEESDPLKSNAIQSSLWEIQTLQNHNIPSIATAARFINNPLPSVEWDLSAVLDTSADDIFDRELKRKSREIIMNFEKPQLLSLPKNEKVMQYWKLM